MTNKQRNVAVAVAAVVLVVIGAVALALRSKDTSRKPTAAASSVPGSTSQPGSATSTGPTSSQSSTSAPSGPPRCTTADLDVTFREVAGGASHGGMVLVFTNKHATCVIAGFPGVDGVAADGSHVVSARRTPNGYLGGPQGDPAPITLATGASASALFEGINGQVDSMGPCPAYTSLAIIAPDDTATAIVPWPQGSQNPLCYPEIHPVVAGNTGGANTPS